MPEPPKLPEPIFKKLDDDQRAVLRASRDSLAKLLKEKNK